MIRGECLNQFSEHDLYTVLPKVFSANDERLSANEVKEGAKHKTRLLHHPPSEVGNRTQGNSTKKSLSKKQTGELRAITHYLPGIASRGQCSFQTRQRDWRQVPMLPLQKGNLSSAPDTHGDPFAVDDQPQPQQYI